MDPWHSKIKIPSTAAIKDKDGNVSLHPTLTPSGALSRVHNQPSVQLVPEDMTDTQRELQYQKDKLRLKLEHLKTRSTDNQQLATILKDYDGVYQHMKHQDKTHESQLKFILKYIDDIKETHKLTDSGLAQVQQEHDKLFEKLQQVKTKISSINI